MVSEQELLRLVQNAYEEGVEDGLDWPRDGSPQPKWIDSVARVELLRAIKDTTSGG